MVVGMEEQGRKDIADRESISDQRRADWIGGKKLREDHSKGFSCDWEVDDLIPHPAPPQEGKHTRPLF